jgi:hypothetical protein
MWQCCFSFASQAIQVLRKEMVNELMIASKDDDDDDNDQAAHQSIVGHVDHVNGHVSGYGVVAITTRKAFISTLAQYHSPDAHVTFKC